MAKLGPASSRPEPSRVRHSSSYPDERAARRSGYLSVYLARTPWLLLIGLSFGIGCNREPAPNTTSCNYLFCFWNVENLFDDQVDGRENAADREFDSWFARDRDALDLKLDRISEAIIQLNEGKGPDILALAEVESLRAAELLRDALNRRLPDQALHYRHILMKEIPLAGRHIAPAILTRLPAVQDRTRLHGNRQRILEGHIQVNSFDLVVIASHWTSRVRSESGASRARYADQIYGVFKGLHKRNPKVDFVVCGDFNDPPDAPSVADHLRATSDLEAVLRPTGEPCLLNLFANKDPATGFGTHYYNGKWMIYDEIVVSSGLLDEEGWSCQPSAVATVNSLHRADDRARRPWRFGSQHDLGKRGYSDHFPVTVPLRVQAAN